MNNTLINNLDDSLLNFYCGKALSYNIKYNRYDTNSYIQLENFNKNLLRFDPLNNWNLLGLYIEKYKISINYIEALKEWRTNLVEKLNLSNKYIYNNDKSLVKAIVCLIIKTKYSYFVDDMEEKDMISVIIGDNNDTR